MKISNIIALLTALFFIPSCQLTCDEYLNQYSKIECQMILTKNPNEGIVQVGNNFTIEGKDLITNEQIRFNKMATDLMQHSGYFSNGDTFIKKLSFNYYVLCKKKYRFYYLWYCKNGEFYGNYFIDSFYQFKLDEIPTIDSNYSTNLDAYQVIKKPYNILDKNFRKKLDSSNESRIQK